MDESKIRNDPTVTVLARLTNGQVILAEKNWKEWSSFGAHLLTLTGQTCLHGQAIFHSLNKSHLIFLKSPTPRTVDAGLPLTHYLNERIKKDPNTG